MGSNLISNYLEWGQLFRLFQLKTRRRRNAAVSFKAWITKIASGWEAPSFLHWWCDQSLPSKLHNIQKHRHTSRATKSNILWSAALFVCLYAPTPLFPAPSSIFPLLCWTPKLNRWNIEICFTSDAACCLWFARAIMKLLSPPKAIWLWNCRTTNLTH